jgi:hypothetical protein
MENCGESDYEAALRLHKQLNGGLEVKGVVRFQRRNQNQVNSTMETIVLSDSEGEDPTPHPAQPKLDPPAHFSESVGKVSCENQQAITVG